MTSQRAVDTVVEDLASRHPDVDRDEVRHVVEEAWEPFRDAPIQEFVPILVSRRVRSWLSDRPRQQDRADAPLRRELSRSAAAG